MGKEVKVGDFVELKNSNIDDGTKISHLTYIGDSDVGKRVNFGCGTVTCNYDGKKKYRTTIETIALSAVTQTSFRRLMSVTAFILPQARQ